MWEASLRRWALLAAVGAALLAARGAGEADWPVAHIQVLQAEGQVAFEFFGEAAGAAPPPLRVGEKHNVVVMGDGNGSAGFTYLGP